jgi:hypothetical protein
MRTYRVGLSNIFSVHLSSVHSECVGLSTISTTDTRAARVEARAVSNIRHQRGKGYARPIRAYRVGSGVALLRIDQPQIIPPHDPLAPATIVARIGCEE